MYVCLNTCIHVTCVRRGQISTRYVSHMYACMHVCMYVCIMYVCMYVYMNTCKKCMYCLRHPQIQTCLRMHVVCHVCMYVCMYV